MNVFYFEFHDTTAFFQNCHRHFQNDEELMEGVTRALIYLSNSSMI